MRMMVESRDLLDLRQQPLIDLLDIAAGKRTCLRGTQCTQ
jgi:hypothetical protein